jgi:hypothetical protein
LSVSVKIPTYSYNNEEYRLIRSDCRFKRPKTQYGLVLDTELHNWLKKHKINYSLIWQHYSAYQYFNPLPAFIVFENNEDAILFKLTWC